MAIFKRIPSYSQLQLPSNTSFPSYHRRTSKRALPGRADVLPGRVNQLEFRELLPCASGHAKFMAVLASAMGEVQSSEATTAGWIVYGAPSSRTMATEAEAPMRLAPASSRARTSARVRMPPEALTPERPPA